MSELKPAYKQALLDARDAFNEKYGDSINVALSEVLDKYGIDSKSELAHVLRITMGKVMQGLEQKRSFYDDWFKRHSQESEFVADNYFEIYPSHSTDYGLIFSDTSFSPELERLLTLDIGRNRVVMHAVNLITQHIGDVTKPSFGDTSIDITGSIIARAFKMYYDKNGPLYEVGVDFTSKRGISILSDYRDDVRAALG